MGWKIIVMLLFWEITGAAVYWIYMGSFLRKVKKLDPKNDELFYELIDVMSFGLLDAKKHDGENDADRDKRILGQSEQIAGESLLANHLKNYFMWPKSMAGLIAFTEQAYETMKSEYDRGIRVRKEPVSQ